MQRLIGMFRRTMLRRLATRGIALGAVGLIAALATASGYPVLGAIFGDPDFRAAVTEIILGLLVLAAGVAPGVKGPEQ